MRQSRRIILKALLFGAAICSVILFFFGDGWAMAFYLAVEGIMIGGLIGAIVGVLLSLILKGADKG